MNHVNLNLVLGLLAVTLSTSVNAVESQPHLGGEELVNMHCTRCHMAPEPADLPKETWPIVLAWMGNYLGIINNDERIRQDRIVRRDVLKQPIIHMDDFERMSRYFITNARTQAEMLVVREKLPVIEGFKVVDPKIALSSKDMAFSLAVDEDKKLLYVGTAGASEGISAFDIESGRQIANEVLESVPIRVHPTRTGLQVVTMGGRLENTGKGQVIDIEGFGSDSQRFRMLVNGFNRTTDIKWRDLNGDRLDDMVLTGFGNLPDSADPKGRVSIFWQTPAYSDLWLDAPGHIDQGPLSGAFREKTLIREVGNLGSVVEDLDNDGDNDILILKANARQQLILFVNQGNESFERRVVSEVGPSFGYLSFTAADFNDDGYMDLLVSNGNNQELESNKPARPYHGIRILENNRNLTFTERFFYPMYGSTWSRARDFDGDGDLDIASTAFFPSLLDEKSSETFVYLENNGNYQFTASTLDDRYYGRWISMAVGDVNGDNKADIVLGLAMDFFTGAPKKWKNRSRAGLGDKPEDFVKATVEDHVFTPVLYLVNQHDF